MRPPSVKVDRAAAAVDAPAMGAAACTADFTRLCITAGACAERRRAPTRCFFSSRSLRRRSFLPAAPPELLPPAPRFSSALVAAVACERQRLLLLRKMCFSFRVAASNSCGASQLTDIAELLAHAQGQLQALACRPAVASHSNSQFAPPEQWPQHTQHESRTRPFCCP